jgi:hypothetical protein
MTVAAQCDVLERRIETIQAYEVTPWVERLQRAYIPDKGETAAMTTRAEGTVLDC